MNAVNASSWNDQIRFVHPGGSVTSHPATYDFFVEDGSKFKRVVCRSWAQRAEALKDKAHYGIQTYEGDVNPIRRFFVDHPEVKIAVPNACYLDFEADSRATFFQHTTGRSRVLCWTIKGKTDGKLAHAMLPQDDDQAERRIMVQLWQELEHYDLVLAWNGGQVDSDILKGDEAKHGFDFYVLIRRSNRLGCLPKWWRRLLYLDHLSCFKRNNMNSGNAEERVSFGLDAIGQALGVGGKTGFDSSKTWEAWSAGGKERARLMEYNINDVEVEAGIESKSKYLDVFQSLCEVCSVFPDTAGLQPMRQVDGLMLHYGNKMGVHFPTKSYDKVDEKAETFDGAYCEGPHVEGIVENVHVADFKGLYPSIMMTMNISPETLGKPGITIPTVEDDSSELTFDNTRVGVLPACVADMIRLREHWKQEAKKHPKGSPEEQEAARKSMAYKMANNSFMGVNSSPYSRYYLDGKLGRAICRTGVALIQAARDEFKKKYGWNVIYIDTDSLNVPGPGVSEFKTAVHLINEELLPTLAKSWGCISNTFFLEYEKQFAKVLFAYDTKKAKYARKKYIYRLAHKGFTPPKPGSEVGFVGIEMKRGDSSRLARQLQKKVIDRLMAATPCTPEELIKIIEDFRIFVFHNEHPVEDVQISKSITKPLDSYGEKMLPNVVAARMMRDKGHEVREGSKMQFVVTKAKGRTGTQEIVLAEDYTGKLDREFLWTQSVYPGTYRLVKAAYRNDTRFDKYSFLTKYERLENKGQCLLPL